MEINLIHSSQLAQTPTSALGNIQRPGEYLRQIQLLRIKS